MKTMSKVNPFSGRGGPGSGPKGPIMNRVYALVLFGLLMGTSAWATTQVNMDAKRQLTEALAELHASDVEWRQNEAEFRELRRVKTQSDNDPAVVEFAEFVASLHRKMLEACQKYRTLGGDPDRLGFKCRLPEEKPASGQGSPQTEQSAQTAGTAQTDMEKMASVEDPLSKSLNEFDQWQQEKEEKLREIVASKKSEGGPPGSKEGKEKGDGGNIQSEPGGAEARSGGSSSKGRGERGVGAQRRMAEAGVAPGVEKQAKTSPRSEGVGGGSDDDVVARQLQEAAEKEQDPVMKEKLWEEYRKYKASKR